MEREIRIFTDQHVIYVKEIIEELPYCELICGTIFLRKNFNITDETVNEVDSKLLYEQAIQTSKKKDLVVIPCCKNCRYYISAENMKNDEMYKDYKNILGHDGLCMSTDKWTDEIDFCIDCKV